MRYRKFNNQLKKDRQKLIDRDTATLRKLLFKADELLWENTSLIELFEVYQDLTGDKTFEKFIKWTKE